MSSGFHLVPLVLGKQVDDLETLARNPLLARLDVREFGVLIEHMDHADVPVGNVHRDGDDARSMFFLLAGSARIHRNQIELRPLLPGDHFGELSLVGARIERVSIEAMTPLRLARLPRSRFESLLRNHPMLAHHILEGVASALADELALMTDEVGALTRQRSLPRRTSVMVKLGGNAKRVSTGTPARALVPAHRAGSPVVAVLLDNKPVSLDTPIVSDVTLAPLTLADAEGREIYRRSVGLLVLEAARSIAASSRFWLGPSVGSFQILSHDGSSGLSNVVLAARMTEVAAKLRSDDIPFSEELWSAEEARAHLHNAGWPDAAALLRTWREPTVPLVSCGLTYVLSQGPMLRSASLIEPLQFRPHPSGILVDLGDSIARHLPMPTVVEPLASELMCPRFDGEMVLEHHRWLDALGVTSVGSFNETCIAGQVSRIIHVAEGFQEKRIARVADEIAYRRGKARLVCIAGPSSSGKTTFLKRLSVQLEINGFRAVTLSLDDYYVDREKNPRDDHGELDFERLDALDLDLLRSHVSRLLQGVPLITARYDFITGRSAPDGGRLHQLGPADILLIEGIHGLNPGLFDGVVAPETFFKIFIHPATTLPLDRFAPVSPSDIRLLRRIVRDRHQRGYRAADNIARWPSVLRGEAIRIYPYLPSADVVFDTSLIYEPAVLKVFAERYLLEVTPEDPTYPIAFRLRQLVDRFVTIYPDHVPPTSILREFIGRGSEG